MKIFFAAAVCMLLATASAHAARPDAPWCAQYSGYAADRNCGFHTFEQCRADISGLGGHCLPNPWFYDRFAEPRRYRHRRHVR